MCLLQTRVPPVNRVRAGMRPTQKANLKEGVSLQLQRAQALEVRPGVWDRGQSNRPGVGMHMLLPCDRQLLQLQTSAKSLRKGKNRQAIHTCVWSALCQETGMAARAMAQNFGCAHAPPQ